MAGQCPRGRESRLTDKSVRRGAMPDAGLLKSAVNCARMFMRLDAMCMGCSPEECAIVVGSEFRFPQAPGARER